MVISVFHCAPSAKSDRHLEQFLHSKRGIQSNAHLAATVHAYDGLKVGLNAEEAASCVRTGMLQFTSIFMFLYLKTWKTRLMHIQLRSVK